MKRGIISIINLWAVQSLKTMISDGSHASFLLNARRREPWWERKGGYGNFIRIIN